MSKALFPFLFLFVLIITGCSDSSDESDNRKFEPTAVLLKTKSYYPINQVFDFINSVEPEVETFRNGFYVSQLSPDSLQYVLDYVNSKSYVEAGGYNHYLTQQITLFPNFSEIKNRDNQRDWLETMKVLKLSEKSEEPLHGYTIKFHVPEGSEKLWEKKFRKYEFVEWVELNYIFEGRPW